MLAADAELQIGPRRAAALHRNLDHLADPGHIERDERIKTHLLESDLVAESFNGALLHEPWTIENQARKPFQVFTAFWRNCLATSGGPFLFGERTMADAMYAPVVTRFVTYDVKLEPELAGYANTIMAMPEMQDWIEAAKAEPAEIEELEVEY